MTRSPWQQSLPPTHIDVAIVGGGVIGCATALALHEARPDLSIVIVEAERLAYGASGRNAGFVLLGAPGADPGSEDPREAARAKRLWRFTEENAEAVRRLDADDPSFGLQWTGSIIAAGSREEAAMLQRQAEVMDGVSWISPEALESRIGSRSLLGGLFVENGGTLDPAAFVRSLAARSGATVIDGTPVERIDEDDFGVQLHTASGVIRAQSAVVCVNAYLPRLMPSLAAYVRPVRAQMLATSPLAPVLDVPVYSHDGYYYLRQRSDGRLLLGGARHLHAETEVGYEDETTTALQNHLQAYLEVHFRDIDVLRVERRWSGTMGFSPDGLPFVTTAPDLPSVHVASGFTGHGMGYSVRFGRLMARRILGEEDPAADLFTARRFSTFREISRGDLAAPEA